MSCAYGGAGGTSIGTLGDAAGTGLAADVRSVVCGLHGVRDRGASSQPEQAAQQRDHEPPHTHAAHRIHRAVALRNRRRV